MKKAARALAAALAGVLLLGPVPAAAAEDGTPKEEVVYIKLGSDGTPASVDVVNIFSLTAPGQIVDHGDYTAVRNMTTTAPLDFDGETVTASAEAGRLYYEGHLENTPIPWTFSLRYLLDGKEISAQDLAGKSGDLEMRLTIRENPSCRGNFFDSHALQVSFTLDTGRCRGIQAEGATAANVGGDKQLTFTVLPGQGADILVRALVTDFEMDAIAVNGVPLSLDVEVDDQALLDKVTALTEAVAALDDGAGELSGGTEELATGADEAAAGASALYSGASSLQAGASALQSGGASVQSGAYSVSAGASEVETGAQSLKGGLDQLGAGLAALNGQSAALTDGSAQVLEGLQTLQTSLAAGQNVDTAGITATLNDLSGKVDDLTATLSGMSGAADSLKGILASLREDIYPRMAAVIESESDETLKAELQGIQGVLYNVIGSYATVMLNLAPLMSLKVKDLQDSLGKAKDCLTQLSGVAGGLGALKEGVDGLVTAYTDLDAGIRNYTAGVASACAGYGQLAPGASALAEGASSLADGAGSLYSGAATLAGGISDVYAATGALAEGAGTLNTGAAALAEGVTALDEGAATLKEGTAAMRQETDGMDGKIQDSVNGLLDAVTGGGSGRIVSYVSSRNRSVQAVQFVIQFPAIRKPAPAETEAPPAEELTFWDRLTALF